MTMLLKCTNNRVNLISEISLFSIKIFLLLISLFSLAACAGPSIKPLVEDQAVSKVESHDTPPAFDTALYQQGITALDNNELAEAQQIFNQFIDRNPGLSGAYTNLALIHFKLEEYEQSLKLTSRALELNMKQPEAYHLSAQIFIKMGKINDALAHYQKAIELKPAYRNAHYNLALLYDIYLQEIELAVKHYQIYMTLIEKPDQPTQEWIDHLKGMLKNG